MSPEFPSGDTASSPRDDALVFVSDSSAEAERLTSALRGRGYAVVDVPLAMLVGRVAVQKPALILCDVDAPGALDQIKRLRDVPFGGRVDIIFLGESGRTLDQQKDEVFHESSGFFVRPVDTFGLLKKVEALIGAPSKPERAIGVSSRPPASLPASRPPGALIPSGAPAHVAISSSAPPAEESAASPPDAPTTPPPPRRPPQSPSPGSSPSSSPRRSSPVPNGPPDSILPQPIPLGFAHAASPIAQQIPQSEISAELESILARAEQRVGALAKASPAPPPRLTPEAEVDAVLPAEVLAALDEPLDSDEGEESSSGTGHGSESAGTGGSVRTGLGTGAGSMSGTGSRHLSQARADTAPPPRRGPDEESAVPDEEPPPATPPAADARPPVPPSWPAGAPSRAMMTAVEAKPTSARFSEREPPPTTAVARPTPLPPSPEVPPSPPEPARSASTPAPRRPPAAPEIPAVIGEGDAALAIARAIRSRFTGAVAFENEQGIRRVVLRDGDFVTAASGATSESLVYFLSERGTIAPAVAKGLAHKLPPFGRHAGAALIAHGHLRQDELWPVLRAHAEWLVGAIVGMQNGGASIEHEVPARLEAEPAVFGGATGAEVFVEIVRRVVSPERALSLLGGPSRRLEDGPNPALLGECALAQRELELVKRCRSASVAQALELGPRDFATVLWALALLGVLDAAGPAAPAPVVAQHAPGLDPMDEHALRSRILARKALVEDGDYFALLGLPRSATSYDVERAYAELRQEFEPSRILTSGNADLKGDVDLILEVLDEAREILGHPQRRERYRRAVEAPGPR